MTDEKMDCCFGAVLLYEVCICAGPWLLQCRRAGSYRGSREVSDSRLEEQHVHGMQLLLRPSVSKSFPVPPIAAHFRLKELTFGSLLRRSLQPC